MPESVSTAGSTPEVIIVVSGGVVQQVVANQPVHVTLVDWDNIEAGDQPGPYPVDMDDYANVRQTVDELLADKGGAE